MIYRDNSPYPPRLKSKKDCIKFGKSGMKDLSLLLYPFRYRWTVFKKVVAINPKWKRARYEVRYIVDIKRGQYPPSGYVKL
jgi:hypothetical protein